MNLRMQLLLVACLAVGLFVTASAAGERFLTVEAKTFDDKAFVFPADLRGARLNVLFLSMTNDMEKGEYLERAMLDWQEALDARDALGDGVMGWHFPVLSGPPFFVRGMITRGMRKSYDGKVPLDQAGVLFVDDLDAFAAAAGLVVDDRPTIVITTADVRLLQTFKGDVTPESADAVARAIAGYLADAH